MTASVLSSVPLVDLVSQQAEIADDVNPALAQVLANASFIGGKPVGEFERAYAEYAGSAHCIGVANGTDAIELALRGAGLVAGDEVILPANSFIATAEAVSRLGAVPVLVDADPTYLLIDPAAVRAAVTERTKAIVPVHLFGQSAFVEQLTDIAAEAGAVIIEDGAQSQGATRNGVPTGTTGLAAATSFYPGKNLGAAGDAGAVLTDDAALAQRVRTMSAHGSATKYVHEMLGFNSRLDTVQAVVLHAKLKRLAAWNDKRRAAADRYAELLADVDGVQVPTSAPGNVDVWHLYVVRVDDRDAVLADLNASGVGAGIHYPTPIHLTGAYADLGYGEGAFPVSEAAARRILSLPIFPHITEEQQVFVVNTLRRVLAGR